MITLTDILNARILVVDDQVANVKLLEGMLRVAGYTTVDSTSDPRDVCGLQAVNNYSLILLDLQMPIMDGFEVMEALKLQQDDDTYLPVLVITAQPDHKLRALEAGAKDFVSKPFDMAELRARVHNMLQVRLLHLEAAKHAAVLDATIKELEASREVIRFKTLAEAKQREIDLLLAQETQESLLPRTMPEFDGFTIRAHNTPTRYVGGDFYDFLELTAGGWVGLLADVSGKGIAAALLSSMVLGALNMEVRGGTQPQEVLNRVNQLMFDKSLPYQFVTLFFFVLNSHGQGQFISAGHNPAYVYRAATGKIEDLVSDAYVLGMFDYAAYQSQPLHLHKGDVLVVYSDGLTDAQGNTEEMFGEKRLRNLMREAAPNGSAALETLLLDSLKTFTEGVQQTDDITWVIVEKS